MKFQIFQKLKASITINSLNYVHVSDINKPNNLQYRKSYPEIAFFDEDIWQGLQEWKKYFALWFCNPGTQGVPKYDF